MYVRMRKASTVLGNTYCSAGITENIDDKYEEQIKEKANSGVEINIYINGEWIDAKKYFDEQEENKKEIEKEQEVEENTEDEIEQEENEEVDYSYLFEGQWMSQVKNVKEFTDDIEKLEEILEYAKENDVTDAVIERVEDYIYELEG